MLPGLLPYFSLILLFFALPFRDKDKREKFLYALILWGVYIFCTTELLSFFNAVTFPAVLCSWIIFILICSAAFFYQKNKIIKFPAIQNKTFTCLILLTATLSIIPLMTGLVYPPNNVDSMTYHLPRIEHWIQNQSLAMYPTNIPRQNVSSPFAEMILLHLRILSGNDILYNSLQWIGYVSCILLSSFLAKILGAQTKGQIFTALFCTSISMAVLQASSTQNDLVVSLWLIAALTILLLWYKNNSVFLALLFGCSIGLACLTKGTAFAYGLPMIFCFGLYSLFHAKERFFYACLAGLCAFLILTPFSIRNYLYAGDIFGGPAMKLTSLQNHGLNYILANLFCMIFVNFDCGDSFVYAKITELATCVFSILNIDTSVLFPYYGSFLQRSKFYFHEDVAVNYFHFILILISIFLIKKFTRKQRNYAVLVLSMFLTLSIVINWQLWISRLLTPFFIAYSPVMGILTEKSKKIFFYLLIILFIFNTLFANIKNKSKRLSFNTINIASVVKKREENYFTNNVPLYKSYHSAINNLLKYHTIGLVISGNSYEYPLWAILHSKGWNGKIIHIMNESDIQDCDVIVMLDVKNRFEREHKGNVNEVCFYEIKPASNPFKQD